MTRVADQSLFKTILRIYRDKELGKAMTELFVTIARWFFFPQHQAALLPGRIPISAVDHPLDKKIPFEPGRVAVYLDFVPSWIRMIGFLLDTYDEKARAPALDFIITMKKLYLFAAEVYLKNFSTTKRPHYYGRLRFLIIHLTDPHLMCVPSLHVMIVIRTWTKFRTILAALGEEAARRDAVEEVRNGALAITEAVLFIKQHSLNCISAALYAMNRFDPALFTEADAADFAARLFTGPGSPPESALLRDYITARYRGFVAQAIGQTNGQTADRPGADWRAPLFDFLENPNAPIDV
jgi:hypothetical protein